MHLKHLYGPKNNKGKAFILNLLKSGVCRKAEATESSPRRKWKASNEAEPVPEEAGQARGGGEEGWEPPRNTSKTQTSKVRGEPGWEPRSLPQLHLTSNTARPKGQRGETPGTGCCGLCQRLTASASIRCLSRVPSALPALTSPPLCRSGLK